MAGKDIEPVANPTLKTVRLALWGLVLVAGGAAGAIWYLDARNEQQALASRDYIGNEQFGAGDYRLVTHKGETVDDSVFTGAPSLVFFGFTHCPDVCPTTLADMQYWFNELEGDAGDVRAYFVSVDPERDTPEVLGNYVTWVSDKITGITGEVSEIDKIVDARGVYAEKAPLEGGGYNVDHTASVFMIDSDGGFFGTIGYGEDPDTALDKIRRLVAEG